MKKIAMLVTALLISINAFAVTVEEVLASFSTLKSYKADFKQVTEIENFGKDEYIGTIYIINKYRALWDYSYPYKQFYLFKPDGVDYYDSEMRQLVRQKNAAGNQNAITQLMLDMSNIQKDFYVTINGENILTLVPRSDMGVRFIHVEFEGKTLKKVISQDPTGNKTEVTFSNIIIDSELDKKLLEPSVPAGTEIFNY